MNIRAVIMAGGSGTRFWPLSRKKTPKQMLDIAGSKSMIEQTVDRLLPLFAPQDILTVAGPEPTAALKPLLKRLPRRNFIVEPLARNTAPSLMLATAKIFLEDPETVVAALAADHLIREPRKFLQKLRAGAEAAFEGDNIITFGIPPTFPATGYGYIHFSKAGSRTIRRVDFHPVLKFREKPAIEDAERFLAAGDYYWNSGMFLWRADVFARKLKKYAPGFYPFWEGMLEALGKQDEKALLEVFRNIPALSIDYALMEKAKGVLICSGDFGWSDVGSWSSLYDIWPSRKGNTAKGKTVAVDSEGCLVYSPKKLTALVGVKDLIVVDADDALLICRRDADQKVKDIVEILKKEKSKYV